MEPIGSGTLTEIRKEAAAWLIEMDVGSDWDRQGFVAWLKSSPRHMEEFLHQTALWRALDDIEPGRIDVRGLLKESENVIDWPETAASTEPARDSRAGTRLLWVAGFASICLAFFLASGLWNSHDANVLTTIIGEQRAVRLPDRSLVQLNTDSRVEIRFSKTLREVRLLRGEALFSVEHDATRPFRVHTEQVTLEAIGTQFNVRRGTDTIVSVIEGRVAVAPAAPADTLSVNRFAGSAPLQTPVGEDTSGEDDPASTSREWPQQSSALTVLAAGEQARIAADGAIKERTTKNMTSATAWRERQLVFQDTPLSEVVAEVARYNAEPQLRIESEMLGERRLTGVFAADDPQSLIQFLERDTELSIIRSGNTVVIRSRL